jgi:hypothetical protein
LTIIAEDLSPRSMTFNDPILHALLARDGLKVEEVRRFLDEMRQRLRLARRKAA